IALLQTSAAALLYRPGVVGMSNHGDPDIVTGTGLASRSGAVPAPRGPHEPRDPGRASAPRAPCHSLLPGSPAMAGQRASGGSRSASQTAGWKAATPTRLSSSAPAAATT